MNINTVTITAQILNTKDVDLYFQTKGTVASGYTLKEITYSPKKVRIKGETDVLNKVAKITIPDDVLDMSGATEDVETTVDITSYLPDGTSLVLAADAKVEVKVKVEPITTKTFEVDASAFTLENIPDRQRRRLRKIRFRLRSPERKAILRSCQQMTLQVLLICRDMEMVNIISLQILMWIMNFIR